MKYAWIEKMDAKDLWWFSIAVACELLEVSRSGFYDWRARRGRRPTTAERERQLLVAAITVEHIASKGRYGSPRIHAELVDQGWQIGVDRIARLMAAHGLQGRSGRRRRHHLTRQAAIQPDIPDLVRRQFTVATSDTVWSTGRPRHAATHQALHRSRGLPAAPRRHHAPSRGRASSRLTAIRSAS